MKKIFLAILVSLFFISGAYAAGGTGIGETYTTYKELTTAPSTPTATYNRLYFTAKGLNFINALGQVVPIANSSITPGSGTGVTVINNGYNSRTIYKVTVTYAALSAAVLTADKVIATIPAKTRLITVIADTTVPYTGGATSAAALIVGKAAGGAQYIATHDVRTAAIVKGLADADMGTELTRAAAINGGAIVDWVSAVSVYVRITTVSANTNALTAGSTTYYLVCESF